MKKNNLFKAVGIVILIYILASWLVPIIYGLTGLEGEVSNQIGIISIFSVVLETFSGFGTVVLFVLMVGAFYGVLKATGAYDKMMDVLTAKAKGKERCYLITIIVAMAVISSVSGLDLGLLIFFPFLIGLVVKMGYDKLVALSATVGATIIGIYGATFASTLYGVNNTILGLKTFDQILVKVIFFVLGLAALIAFVLMYCMKDKKVAKKSATKKVAAKKSAPVKAQKVESKAKKSVTKSATKKNDKGATALPAFIVIGILFLIIFLGTTSWEAIFGSNIFATAHEAWTGFTVGGFEIANKLFGGVDALGTWATPVRFQTYSIFLVIAMIVMAVIYRKSVKDTFEGFVDGLKSFVVPAIITILVCAVFVFVYYNPVITPVTSLLLSATKEFNVVLTGIYAIINSVFYVDYYYLAYTVVYSLTSVFEDTAVLSIASVMFTNLYGLVMLVAPTSLLLLLGLAISEVEYTTWLKYIWKLALTLLIISFIVFTIMLFV